VITRQKVTKLLDIFLNSAILIENQRRGNEMSDINKLLVRAEHEISYGAKRAIEMFLPVWDKDKCLTMFDKCAESHCLCQGEVEKCKLLMNEMGIRDKPTEVTNENE